MTSAISAGTGGLCLTFDDHSIGDWHRVIPLFERYGARATFFISRFPELPAGDVARLRDIAAAGHEIAYHSVHHHRPSEFLRHASVADYLAIEIDPGMTAMEAAGFRPTSFAYPYNECSTELDDVLARRFCVRRTRTDDPCVACHPKTGNGLLHAWPIDQHSENPLIWRRAVDDTSDLYPMAAAEDRVLVCYGHRVANCSVPHHYITEWGLEYLLHQARARGLRFVTASELA